MVSTIKEIARRANVSIATVSRALNNSPKVTEQTRQLIQQIADELNYKPNLAARNFVKKTSNVIGLILPDIADEFFSELIKGIDEVCYDNDYYTMVISTHRYRTLEETLNSLIRSGLLGGLIILIPNFTEPIKKLLSFAKMPVVLIGGGLENNEYDIVSLDNYQGIYDITKYLIRKCNYTNLVHLSGPIDNDDAAIRIQAFRDCCNEFNIPSQNAQIIQGDFTRSSGVLLGMEIMNLKNKPEVIVAANDMMALGCYDAAKKKGLSIPDDIAVTGFDDIFVSQYLTPSLTTVRAQIEKEGHQAAELLMSKLNGNSDSSKIISRIKIPTELVIRNSIKQINMG
jgi:LacI family transcriptional regulator